jgi:hypothetical protein
LSAPPFQLTRHRPFVLFWCARTATAIAYQMQAVAIGWQIYELTGSALDLGLLRSAPAVGALLMSIALTRFAFDRKAGVILFVSTGIFGVSILVFALSTSHDLSLAALTIYGAMDAVSVVIRHSLVQLRTPDEILGRVMAVNSMFTGTTSTLGEFESGAVAAWLGVVPSALIGGVGAIVVAAIWWRAFPEIARIDRLAPEP